MPFAALCVRFLPVNPARQLTRHNPPANSAEMLDEAVTEPVKLAVSDEVETDANQN